MTTRSWYAAFAFTIAVSFSVGTATELKRPLSKYELDGRHYAAMPTLELYRDIVPEIKADPRQEWSKDFLVRVAGPRTANALGAASSAKSWTVVRMYPADTSGYVVVFERPLTRKWVNMLPITDRLSTTEVVKDRELLCVQISIQNKAYTLQDDIQEFEKQLSSMACFPADQQEIPLWETIYFSADRAARPTLSNVMISVHTNFSEVRNSLEFYEVPSKAGIPVLAVAGILKYLDQPFPHPNQLLHADKGYVFSVAEEGGQQWPAPTCNRRSVVSRKRKRPFHVQTLLWRNSCSHVVRGQEEK